MLYCFEHSTNECDERYFFGFIVCGKVSRAGKSITMASNRSLRIDFISVAIFTSSIKVQFFSKIEKDVDTRRTFDKIKINCPLPIRLDKTVDIAPYKFNGWFLLSSILITF